jgi:hypothetical protein
MNRSCLLAVVISVVFLAGCATPARMEQMTTAPQAGAAASVPEALRQNIAIKDVTGGQETNPMWTSQVSSAEFEKALESSLRTANLLEPNRQGGRYALSVYLDKLDQPFIGFNMTVTATVTYTLIERSTGKTTWEKKLVTPYTASFGDALLGVERLRLANEGAVRTNISELVSELYRLRP